jgi:organic hydroperoxide reductase OsmC/OhrA
MSRVRTHQYDVRTVWDGAAAGPTRDYQSYSREYAIEIAGKPRLQASADATFRGDKALHNPEDLLVAALSGCHLLSYLALCSLKKIEVTAYHDQAFGLMEESAGAGRITEVTLRPRVTIAAGSDVAAATALHKEAHKVCFIANSVNFPVKHEPVVEVASE